MITYVSKENNLGPGDTIRYIWRLKGTIFISSPEPKAPGELIGWESSVVHPSVGRPSLVVRPQIQTTSPLKLLGRLQLNFIYSLQGL